MYENCWDSWILVLLAARDESYMLYCWPDVLPRGERLHFVTEIIFFDFSQNHTSENILMNNEHCLFFSKILQLYLWTRRLTSNCFTKVTLGPNFRTAVLCSVHLLLWWWCQQNWIWANFECGENKFTICTSLPWAKRNTAEWTVMQNKSVFSQLLVQRILQLNVNSHTVCITSGKKNIVKNYL